jgi:SAM-dependent methyltransferase
MPSRALTLCAALLTLAACSGDTSVPDESQELRELFPAYTLNFRPVGSSSQTGSLPGSEVLEQVNLSYPAHTAFQFQHELVERQEDPVLAVKLLDLQPGHTVVDIGCGSGFFTVPFARLVGAEGKVWAIDIQAGAVEFLRERLDLDPSLDPHGVVQLKVNAAADAGLPAGTVDRGLLSHANFYAYRPMLDENVAMLGSLERALVPGGRLVVVQFMGLAEGQEMSGDNIRANFLDAGLEVDREQFQPEANVWYFVFRKPST